MKGGISGPALIAKIQTLFRDRYESFYKSRGIPVPHRNACTPSTFTLVVCFNQSDRSSNIYDNVVCIFSKKLVPSKIMKVELQFDKKFVYTQI